MPEWYSVIVLARYAGIPAHDFVKLPLFWQEMYGAAHDAELEAGDATVETE